MQKTFTHSLTLRTCDCDMLGALTPSAALTFMQEVSAAHCEALDIDFKHLDPLGIAWVLSSARVVFDRLPVIGETVSLTTWHLPVRHFFFPRVYVFEDKDGNRLGAGHSLWVLLDVATRKVTPGEYVRAHMPDNTDMETPVPMPRPIRMLSGEPNRASLHPTFTQFDVNGHVNNTHYMNWCVDALGMDVMRENAVMDFTIQYESEILPETDIVIESFRTGEAFTCQGLSGDKRLFSIGGQLGRREA